jgi:ferredoxin
MCYGRLQEGETPACVSECPEDAITFGKKKDLLDEAKKRIYQDPENYVHKVYGEYEVGGTGYLYLASVPYEKLGFRTDLGTKAYPEYTKTFLYSVPVVLTLFPAFLLALSNATKKDDDITGKEG